MPPKGKRIEGSAGKVKRKSSGCAFCSSDAGATLEEKYKRTVDEVDSLKDHLAVRRELARRAQRARQQARDQADKADRRHQQHVEDQQAVTADLTRQYKTLELKMMTKIQLLENELSTTCFQLNETLELLKHTQKERDRAVQERDYQVQRLQGKIEDIQRAYHIVLTEAFDNLVTKLAGSKDSWKHKATAVNAQAKRKLLAFGLSPWLL